MIDSKERRRKSGELVDYFFIQEEGTIATTVDLF
jgi:hypothetical protein